MKIVLGLVLSVVALAFAPMQVPTTCDTCSNPAGGWASTPEDCRDVSDSLQCTAYTTYCSISGTLTVNSWCENVDACLVLAGQSGGYCSANVRQFTHASVPQTYTPNSSDDIPCVTNHCARSIEARFFSVSNCTTAVAQYSHVFLCE